MRRGATSLSVRDSEGGGKRGLRKKVKDLWKRGNVHEGARIDGTPRGSFKNGGAGGGAVRGFNRNPSWKILAQRTAIWRKPAKGENRRGIRPRGFRL